jgi:hypothetical protein
MADFDFSLATTDEEIKKDQKADLGDPLAYVFIGRDKFRTDKRTAQEWRKLFISLSRMAGVSQNTFGLTILFDKLEEIEANLKKQDSKKFAAAIKKHSADIDKEDSEKLVKRTAKVATKNATAEKK